MTVNGLLLPLVFGLFCSTYVTADCENQTTTIFTECNLVLGFNVSYCPLSTDKECQPVFTNCTKSLSTNDTFLIACSSNQLKFYRASDSCASNNSLIINTMNTFCGQQKWGNCTKAADQWILSASVANSVVRRVLNCSTPTTPSPGLKLLPNPVGPDAITAIVVLVCLAITAVLAGFFFWPKCHITDPAAHALKMATKPSAAKTAAAYAATSPKTADNTARVVYEQDKKTATITLPTMPGPSAA